MSMCHASGADEHLSVATFAPQMVRATHLRRERLTSCRHRPHEVRHACLQWGTRKQEMGLYRERELLQNLHQRLHCRCTPPKYF